jgi:hypothetical protein
MLRDNQTRTPPHGDPLMGGAATARAMAGPEIPHNEAGVPLIPGVLTAAEVIAGTPAFALRPRPGVMRTGYIEPTMRARDLSLEAQRPPGSLPCHIERAARQAYAAGHRDGVACYSEKQGKFLRDECDDEHGVDAFRESLQRDADEAVKAVRPDAAPPKETLHEAAKGVMAELDKVNKASVTEADLDRWHERLEDALEPMSPTLRSLLGAAPDMTHGVESVEYVRRKREELAAPPKEVRLDEGPVPVTFETQKLPKRGGPPPDALREALLAHENKVVDMTLACGEKLEHVYRMTAIVRKSREALLALAISPSDAAPVALMKQIHDVLLAVEPFIEFEEPDVSAVALRSEVVSLTHLLANRMSAHPEDAPGGPWEAWELVTGGWKVGHKTSGAAPLPYTEAEAIAVRDALNSLKGDAPTEGDET